MVLGLLRVSLRSFVCVFAPPHVSLRSPACLCAGSCASAQPRVSPRSLACLCAASCVSSQRPRHRSRSPTRSRARGLGGGTRSQRAESRASRSLGRGYLLLCSSRGEAAEASKTAGAVADSPATERVAHRDRGAPPNVNTHPQLQLGRVCVEGRVHPPGSGEETARPTGPSGPWLCREVSVPAAEAVHNRHHDAVGITLPSLPHLHLHRLELLPS